MSIEDATKFCEVGDCREPAFCLVGIGLSGSMYVCEKHGRAAERQGFRTGFCNPAIHSASTSGGET